MGPQFRAESLGLSAGTTDPVTSHKCSEGERRRIIVLKTVNRIQYINREECVKEVRELITITTHELIIIVPTEATIIMKFDIITITVEIDLTVSSLIDYKIIMATVVLITGSECRQLVLVIIITVTVTVITVVVTVIRLTVILAVTITLTGSEDVLHAATRDTGARSAHKGRVIIQTATKEGHSNPHMER